MIKKILIVLVVLIALAAAGACVWLSSMGYFAPVKIVERPMGPITFVYATHKGPYSEVGPTADGVYNRLVKEFGIKTKRGMGIYYDNPAAVKPADLRSDIGCILDGKDAAKADAVMKKMKVRIMYKKNYVTATYPYKSMASIVLGVMKVYPEMSKYLTSKGYLPAPSIEIYDLPNKIITYAFEIKK